MQLYKHKQVVTLLTSKLEVDQSMQPYLLKNSPKSYITPTPKGWREAKKVKTNFDWCVDVNYNSRGPIFIPWAGKSPEGTLLTRYV